MGSPEGLSTNKMHVSPESIRDVVIGMADGLTVPFALAAGLSGAVASTGIVVKAGIAEIAAGSIAMGLGGYLAARTDHEHFHTQMAKEWREMEEWPESERDEVRGILQDWGLSHSEVASAVHHITSDPDRWVDFMMKHELGLEEPKPGRARDSSLTIGISYIVGGLIPLLPYMLFESSQMALFISILVTLIALFWFGYFKAFFLGTGRWKSAWQTALVGGTAAAVAFFAAKLAS